MKLCVQTGLQQIADESVISARFQVRVSVLQAVRFQLFSTISLEINREIHKNKITDWSCMKRELEKFFCEVPWAVGNKKLCLECTFSILPCSLPKGACLFQRVCHLFSLFVYLVSACQIDQIAFEKGCTWLTAISYNAFLLLAHSAASI